MHFAETKPGTGKCHTKHAPPRNYQWYGSVIVKSSRNDPSGFSQKKDLVGVNERSKCSLPVILLETDTNSESFDNWLRWEVFLGNLWNSRKAILKSFH